MIQHFVKIHIEFLVDDFQFVFCGSNFKTYLWPEQNVSVTIIIKSFELKSATDMKTAGTDER